MAGNRFVSEKWASLFGSNEESNFLIEFVVEAGIEPPSKRRKLQNASASGGSEKPGELGGQVLGDPLPGHTFVLRYASEWFQDRLARLALKQQHLALQGGAACPSIPLVRIHIVHGEGPHLPTLRVPLGCAGEVPSARAAIKYAYTGEVAAGSIREALEIWRQASYFQMANSAEDCLAIVKAKLEGGAGGDGAGSSASPPSPPVLEFYACEHVWDGVVTSAPIDPVVVVAKKQLVTHFGDTLAILNRPTLRQQLLALPAVAVEALLESDDFGTDTEDSVLLLLATWMAKNYGSTDAETRERLCWQVRLAQLSRTSASIVLPALSELPKGGWFPISGVETAIFIGFASAKSDKERRRLKQVAASEYDVEMPWYSATPRRQCLPAGGLQYGWRVAADDLKEAVKGSKPDIALKLYGATDTGTRYIAARGFTWRAHIEHLSGKDAAGLYLTCCTPSAYSLGGSGSVVALVEIDAKLEVVPFKNGARQEAKGHTYAAGKDFLGLGKGWGIRGVLPLRPQQGYDAVDGRKVEAWEDYVQNGGIEVRLTLLRPGGVVEGEAGEAREE